MHSNHFFSKRFGHCFCWDVWVIKNEQLWLVYPPLPLWSRILWILVTLWWNPLPNLPRLLRELAVAVVDSPVIWPGTFVVGRLYIPPRIYTHHAESPTSRNCGSPSSLFGRLQSAPPVVRSMTRACRLESPSTADFNSSQSIHIGMDSSVSFTFWLIRDKALTVPFIVPARYLISNSYPNNFDNQCCWSGLVILCCSRLPRMSWRRWECLWKCLIKVDFQWGTSFSSSISNIVHYYIYCSMSNKESVIVLVESHNQQNNHTFNFIIFILPANLCP